MELRSQNLENRGAFCYWDCCSQALEQSEPGSVYVCLCTTAYICIHFCVHLYRCIENSELTLVSQVSVQHQKAYSCFLSWRICNSLLWQWELQLPLSFVCLFICLITLHVIHFPFPALPLHYAGVHPVPDPHPP